jgi:hypothetical protein
VYAVTQYVGSSQTISDTPRVVAALTPASSGYFNVDAVAQLFMKGSNASASCWLRVQGPRGSTGESTYHMEDVSQTISRQPMELTAPLSVTARSGSAIEEVCATGIPGVTPGSVVGGGVDEMTALRVTSAVGTRSGSTALPASERAKSRSPLANRYVPVHAIRPRRHGGARGVPRD